MVPQNQLASLRDYWNFVYRADVLARACSAKLEYHRSRIEWWLRKKAEVMIQVRSSGISIDESLASANNATITNTYSRGPVVTIQDNLVRDLSECISKIKEHNSKWNEYDAWFQVLSDRGQAEMSLTKNDWLFFFGMTNRPEINEPGQIVLDAKTE